MSSVRAAMYWLAAGLFAVTAAEGHAFSGERGSATCGAASDGGGSCEAQNFVGQADFERVQSILERAGMEEGSQSARIREQRPAIEGVRQSAQDNLDALRRQDLPEQLSEAVSEAETAGKELPFSPAPADQQSPSTKHTLFLSASIPAEERRLLLQHAERATESHPDAKVGVYLQGPIGGQDITHTQQVILDWLQDAGIDRSDLRIGMDNKVFDRHSVEVVPTWVSEQDGEVVARAAGLGSLASVLERAEAAKARGAGPDLGRRGQTWAIAEPHFRDEFVPERMTAWIEEQGGPEAIREKAHAAFWDNHPFNDYAMPPAEETASYYPDLSVTASEDIKNPKTGEVIIPKGTTARPSDVIRWTRHMVILDASLPWQVEWAREWLEGKREAGIQEADLLVFLTNIERTKGGTWDRFRALTEKMGRPIYLLDPALKRRLGLQSTPSTVEPARNGRRLRVTEHVVEPSISASAHLTPAWSAMKTGLRRGLDFMVRPAHAESGEGGDEVAGQSCNDAAFFDNLINKVCWDCHTPWSFSGQDQGGDAPPGYYDKSACMCEPPYPGTTTGAWLPARLVEFVRVPYCSPVFGGKQLEFNKGKTDMYASGKNNQGAEPSKASFKHYHYWSFPAGSVVGANLGCEPGPDSIDGMYYSEVDGAWNDDQVAMQTHPEAVLFATTVAQIPCAVESTILASGGEPINELFWCAGSWGSLYPFSGWITHDKSPPREAALLSARVLASLGRRGLLWDLVGDPCDYDPMPQLIKTNFRWQHIFPVPNANNTHWIGEEPIGRWGEHRNKATNGEDYVRLLWRWTDCCLEVE